jgi:macrolide transport system ATP-binding/permease protein
MTTMGCLSNPPDFYLPIETMPVLTDAPYVHDPDAQWLYLVGRVKPGVSIPELQQKVSALGVLSADDIK